MALANDDDVIKTFSADRADQPLRISVLPSRLRRDRSVANAYGPDAPDEGSALRAVGSSRKVELIWGPLRHGAGHNVAFYFRDYIGNIMEYSANEEIILNDTPTCRASGQLPTRAR